MIITYELKNTTQNTKAFSSFSIYFLFKFLNYRLINFINEISINYGIKLINDSNEVVF